LLSFRHPSKDTVGDQYRGGDRLLFSPDGKTLVASGGGAAISLYNAATGKLRLPADGFNTPPTLVVGGDGKTLLTMSNGEQTVRVWDTDTLKQRCVLERPAGSMGCVAISPDGKLLATGGTEPPPPPRVTVVGAVVSTEQDPPPDPPVRIWDAATGKELRKLKGPRYSIHFIAFSADGKTVYTHDGTFTFLALDATSGQEVCRLDLKNHPGGMRALTVDGRTALIHRNENANVLVDTKTGKDLPSSERFRTTTIAGGTFSSDGKTLASVDGTRFTLCLFDVRSGEARSLLPVPTPAVTSTAFSPDGRFLAALSQMSDTVLLFDAIRGKALGRFACGQGSVAALAFSADSKTLLTSGRDGTVLLWDVAAASPPVLHTAMMRTPEEMEKLWTNLRSDHVLQASDAMWALVAAGKPGLTLLTQRVGPAPKLDPAKIENLVADLDSNNFETRKKATEELEKYSDAAEPALKKVLESKPTVDLRKRVEGLLEKIKQGEKERRREGRAVDVLELMRTPEARKRLVELADGATDASLTRAAKAALERLAWME
jgi:WD40 repeat protein